MSNEVANNLALQLQAALEDFLPKIRKARDDAKAEKNMTDACRDWLLKHEGAELYNEREDLVGYLQPGGSSTIYDPPQAIQARNAGLYDRLMELSCITTALDTKRVEECIKDGLLLSYDVAPFRHTRELTPQVKVEKR